MHLSDCVVAAFWRRRRRKAQRTKSTSSELALADVSATTEGIVSCSRSRRKGAPVDGTADLGKENQAACSTVKSTRRGCHSGGEGAPPGSRLTASRSAEFSVCDSISDADFAELMKLPSGLDANEWLAMHALSLFHHINLLYGSLSYEFCTTDTCPVMCGPGNTQYTWVDDKGKKLKCGAPQYIDYVMSFVERNVQSEDAFPTKYGNRFPSDFIGLLKKVSRYLWHVLAHIHTFHWADLTALGLDAQAAAVAVHFCAFVSEFQLHDAKEMQQVHELVKHLRLYCVTAASDEADMGPASLQPDGSPTGQQNSTTLLTDESALKRSPLNVDGT